MLYLASASPRRAKLLREAGISFKRLKSSYHETGIFGDPPVVLVKKHAQGKAMAGARMIENGKLLAADTLVYFQGKILGKPRSRKDAVKTLTLLQGHWHTVVTGVAFFEVKHGEIVRRRLFSERTRVLLKKMSGSEIRNYFRSVNPMDKAGSYAIQSRKSIVKAIKGSFSNAVGLPMERLSFL